MFWKMKKKRRNNLVAIFSLVRRRPIRRKVTGFVFCAVLIGAYIGGTMGVAAAADLLSDRENTAAPFSGQSVLSTSLFDSRSVEGMEITTAVIRDGSSNEQNLLAEGTVTPFEVDFSKQFTLHIVVKSQLNLENKKVEITVPDGLTVVEFPIPERGGMVEDVTPESVDELNSSNNYGGYCPKNGTITYSLRDTAEENSFNIILEPDTTLWNRTKEQVLAEPLTIKAYAGDIDNTTTQHTVSSKAKITGNYDATRAIQTGPRLSRVGVKNGVPTDTTPFALRQVWVNSDKDYIDMPQFFKELEITIALPYYEKDGVKIYAAFGHITYDPAGQSTRKNMMNPENHKDADGNYLDGFSFEQTVNDNHTVTLTWENLYLEYGQEYFTPYFKWKDESAPLDNTSVQWKSESILSTGDKEPGCYEGKEPTSGSITAVKGLITWQDGSKWYPWNSKFETGFTAHSGESMQVLGNAAPAIYNAYSQDKDIVYYLGQFHVVNHGGTKSAPKTVEFEYTHRDSIGVTAQKIPATTGNTVTVWYQTTNTTNDSWTRYSTNLKSEGGFVTFTASMANLVENEYFTKIKADVGSYERDYVGYVASRSSDPTSGYATTFGKLLTDAGATGTTTDSKGNTNPNSTEYKNFATMKMVDTNPSGSSETKLANYTVKVTKEKSLGEIPLAMEQAYKVGSFERLPILSDPETGESKTSATAGDTITFNGLLSSSAYPYSSNNIMTDPEIYIRLPNEITVTDVKLYSEVGRKADKVFLNDAVTETVDCPKRKDISADAYQFEEVTTAAMVDDTSTADYNLYKITFKDTDNPVKVGWFGPELGQYQIGLSFKMTIAKEAEAMTLDMRDCVRFKSASLKSTSNNGTLSQYQVQDTYDMNENNDTTELISTFNVNAEGAKLSVVAQRLGLTFTFGARQVEKGSETSWEPTDFTNYDPEYDPDMKQKLYLKDENHVIALLFTLKNETGREFSEADAKAFYYYIPVPKEGDLWDVHMQDKAFEFDMNLTGAPKLQGNSMADIEVKYAVDINSKANSGEENHYTNLDKYMTEEYLLKDCTTDEEKLARWAEVKMIRIAAKSEVTKIPETAELKVNLRLEPSFRADQAHFDSMADLVGKVVSFGPCGVAPYSVGQTTNQGHNPLPKFRAEFQTGVIAGKIFIDKNFNGVYDENIDELYTAGEVKVETKHQNGDADDDEDQSTTVNAPGITDENKGKFKFSRRRADTYTVTVTNPGSTNTNDANPLKFSLDPDGKFSESDNGSKATVTLVLDSDQTQNDIAAAQTLMIGLQQPHTVTFEAEGSNAVLGFTSTKVWHGDALGASNIPTVTANNDYRFTGNWTAAGKTYTADELKTLKIKEDTTFIAEVKQLYTLNYNGNGSTAGTVPNSSQHIAGESVTLISPNDLKKNDAIFVGWSTEKITDVLPANATQELIGKIITADAYTMPANNVTLYAVYAVDNNGNGNPDYNDESVHVRYHGNNDDKRDIICPHHHVVGENAQLSTNGTVSGRMIDHNASASTQGEQKDQFTFTNMDQTTNIAHIFIGWSTTAMPDVIATKAQYETLKNSIVTEVTMEKAKADGGNADDDGNTNVYAVWAADRNNNQIADYREEHSLTYDGNSQQSGTVSGVPQDNDPHLPSDTVNLKCVGTDATAKPTHSGVDSKKVVFIGWTREQTDKIYSRADNAPATTDTVTFANANKTVYAAWGYDENNNGTADVLETYTLSYDLNGGKETAPTTVSGFKKNTSVTLSNDKNFTRNTGEIFVGWSETKRETALAANADKDDVKKFLFNPGATYGIKTVDVTLYAVWAVDVNGNNKPDYDERYSLKYDGNARAEGDSVENLPTDSKSYAPGSTAMLSGTPTHSDVDDKTVIFIGWTAQATDKIYSRADTAPEIITEVTFDDSNKTVYAAWGYDENGNGVVDNEESHSLTYNGNTQASGTVSGLPTDMNRYIPGDKATLSGTPTHSEVDGKKVVFIGWTKQKTNKIYGRTDTAPDTITEVTFVDADVTVYAAWGYDENDNGKADVLESHRLLYDGNANGGTVENMPADASKYIPGDNVTLSDVVPTHSGVDNKKVIFIGWTETATNKIYSETDTAPDTVKEVTFGNLDITVYAAWGYDNNSNDIADVLESHSLIYKGNAQANGAVGNLPANNNKYLPGNKVTLSADTPTHSDVDGKKVIFIGWTAQATNKIYSRADAAPTTITEVTFDDSNKTVYAAWAYDANGNGTADYLESHTLIYDGNAINGGTVEQLPTDGGKYISGDKTALSGDKPAHSNVDGKKVIFIGWTAQATDKIYSRADTAPEIITEVTFDDSNKTVYAAWAYDENDNGIADVVETYTLTYDLNGGQGAAPVPVTGIQKNTSVKLDMNRNFTRNENEYFVGWSLTKYETAFMAEQESEMMAVLVSGEITVETTDVTLYAVWAENLAVKKVCHKAYIVGYTDGTFGPERNMSRAEAAAIFARLLAEKKGEQLIDVDISTTGYVDVPSSAWYASSVKYLDQYHVIYGRGEQKFVPDDLITRAEFTAIVERFFNVCGENVNIRNDLSVDTDGEDEGMIFDDVTPDHWAAESIRTAASYGWVNGYEDGTFRAEKYITRAEAVTLVNRLLQRSADTAYVRENIQILNTFTDMTEEHWAYMEVMESANTHLTTEGETETWSRY